MRDSKCNIIGAQGDNKRGYPDIGHQKTIQQAKNDTSGLNLLSTYNLMSPGGDGGIFARSIGDGNYSNHYTDAQRDAFTASMKAARDEGVYTDAEIQKLASDSPDLAAAAPFAWQELANRIGVPNVPQSPAVVLAAANDVKKAQSTYDVAAADKDKAQQELDAQMAGFDKTLTPTQRQNYIDAYWKDHKDITDAFNQAATGLNDALAKNGPALESGASAKPPDQTAVDVLYKGYQSLTKSPYAKSAMDFVARVYCNPNLAAGFKDKDLKNDILAPASATVMGQLLADPTKTPDQALAEFKKIFEGYAYDIEVAAQGKELFDKSKEFLEGIQDITKGIGELQALRAGTYTPEDFATKITDWENKGGFSKILAVGGAMWAFKAVYDDAQGGDGLKAVGDLAKALKGSGEVLAQALGAYARAGTRLAEDASIAADALDKFVPFLGVLASGISAAVDIRDAMKGGNAGDWIAAAGDLCSFVGACATSTGIGAPLGELLTGIGSIVSIVGNVVSDVLDQDKIHREQVQYLKAAGFRDAMIDILLKADAEQTQGLADLGLTPDQIQQLAVDCPTMLQSNHGFGPYLGNLKMICGDAGISGQELFDTLIAADRGAQPPGDGLTHVLYFFATNFQGAPIALQMDVMKQKGASPQELRKFLVDQLHAAVKDLDGSPEFQAALNQAAAQLIT